jgi:hypothetical protein
VPMASTVGVYQIRYRLAALSVVYLLNATAGDLAGHCSELSRKTTRSVHRSSGRFRLRVRARHRPVPSVDSAFVAGSTQLVRRPDLRAARWIGILGVGFLVGMVVEPILGEALRGSHDPMVAAVIAGNLAVPGALVAVGCRRLDGSSWSLKESGH